MFQVWSSGTIHTRITACWPDLKMEYFSDLLVLQILRLYRYRYLIRSVTLCYRHSCWHKTWSGSSAAGQRYGRPKCRALGRDGVRRQLSVDTSTHASVRCRDRIIRFTHYQSLPTGKFLCVNLKYLLCLRTCFFFLFRLFSRYHSRLFFPRGISDARYPWIGNSASGALLRVCNARHYFILL